MGRRGRHESTRVLVLSVLALGLLIWAKLRLVTTIPRSAFADPKQNRKVPAQVEPGAAKHPAPIDRAVAKVRPGDPSGD